MEFRKVLALRGPNVWASFPVLEVCVDLGPLKDSPSNELPGFNERLMAWLPSMIEHRCSIGERGGFFERLRRGTYQGHILEHVTIELQNLAGIDVSYGKARETDEDGVYKVVIEFEDEQLGRAALATAHKLCHAAVHDLRFDAAVEVRRLRALADEICLGPSTRAIVEAAAARRIPVRRLNSGSLVQLGWGASQRRILTAETDRTSAIAEAISKDKDLTRTLLRAVGVPVPEGRPVADPDDAWEAAQDIGLPVVVKPRSANHGRGVFTGLTSREQVLLAFQHAAHEGSDVLVERFAPGVEHRLLVVAGQVVAASRGEPAVIVGDGLRPVWQLIDEQINSDPRRGDDTACLMYPVDLCAATVLAIEQQGHQIDSVPEPGVKIVVQRSGNVDTDVTDLVHPEVAARAVEAAQVVGLDIAGLDIVAEDISRPLEAQGGAVVEVNAGPGLAMHVRPSGGEPRPVGQAIVDSMFPLDQNGRIPLVAVAFSAGRTSPARSIGHVLQGAHARVGMALAEGLYQNADLVQAGRFDNYRGAESLLLNPATEAAVCEVSAESAREEGLGFDRCRVAVVTHVGDGDPIDLAGIDTPEPRAAAKRCLVEAARDGWAVLNADDPLAAAMAPFCRGSVIFFAREAAQPVVAQHRTAGGRVAFVKDGDLALAEGATIFGRVPLAETALGRDTSDEPALANVLATAAAAWALGLSWLDIRRGLESAHRRASHA